MERLIGYMRVRVLSGALEGNVMSKRDLQFVIIGLIGIDMCIVNNTAVEVSLFLLGLIMLYIVKRKR